MHTVDNVSRRSFLAFLGAPPLLARLASSKHIPVGLELYSVRKALKDDLTGTVRAVAKLGYQCVEFYSPYYDWTLEDAKNIRKELDELGVRCYSTHNSGNSFTPDGIGKAIELNQALGARYIVLAHPGDIKDVAGWKRIAEMLNTANTTLASHGMHA